MNNSPSSGDPEKTPPPESGITWKTRWQAWRTRPKYPRRVVTPTVLQMEAVECGAAALGIILGYFGRYVPLEELRIACGVSRDGSKASNIVSAARQYGLKVQVFATEPVALRHLNPPLIIHWNFNHFLVVEGFRGQSVYLNDPATGPRKVSAEEFDKSFTGIAATFETTGQFQPGGQLPGLMAELSRRLRHSEIALAYIILASLALVIPGLLLPAFTRIFVDYYLVQGLESWVGPLLVGMGLTAGVRMLLAWLQQKYLLRLETKLGVTSATQVLWHLLRLPIAFFTQRSAGDISSRVGLNDRVAHLLSGELATSILNTLLIVFYAALMLRYNMALTLVTVLVALLNVGVLWYVSRRRTDASHKLVQDQAKALAASYSGLQNIETIKATGAEADFFSRWAGYQTRAHTTNQELGVLTQALAAIPPFLSMLATITTLLLGGLSVMAGDMTIGMLVAFQSLMASFLNPVNQLVDTGGRLQEIKSIFNRLNDVFNYPVQDNIQLVERVSREGFARLSGEVELRSVTFGYSPLGKPLIQDFNLKVKPGARVALVGGSGSGKSTVARLIAGLYQPWGGDILFDGQPRGAIPRAVINHSLSMVDQEIYLVAGSVRDNLTLWDSQVPEENLVRAAQDAHIHHEIMARSGGYDSHILEGGVNFSGGQRQRLEIARALIPNPSILILDEATSALDAVTEQIIDDNLRRRGCTCVIVAHRLSTIRDCDEIIVMDKGRIVQRGTHEQLWREGGVYARLLRSGSSKSAFLVDSLLESLIA